MFPLSTYSKMKMFNIVHSFDGPQGARDMGEFLFYCSWKIVYNMLRWIRTGCNPADINRFQSHTLNKVTGQSVSKISHVTFLRRHVADFCHFVKLLNKFIILAF